MAVITLRLTALALYREPSIQVNAPPHYHDVYSHHPPIVTTCLYTSALLSAELDSCLHP